ncbi:uncharacterized protein [Centruroides vittatus]|uniref:uncharacterized protein n=1 Tax=Centruroides vittatus TaxID=120091 RepID=UPI003510A20C
MRSRQTTTRESTDERRCTCRLQPPQCAYAKYHRAQQHANCTEEGNMTTKQEYALPDVDYQLDYKIPRIKLENGSYKERKVDKDKEESEIWIKDNQKTKKEEEVCRKCQHPVYATERIELNQQAVYHDRCFRCGECGVKLTLSNFCTDLRLKEDVYCRSHRPLVTGRVDATSMHIDVAKRTPKLEMINAQIRGPAAGTGAKYDANALCIQSALKSPKVWERPSSCFQTAHIANDVIKGDVIGLKYM